MELLFPNLLCCERSPVLFSFRPFGSFYVVWIISVTNKMGFFKRVFQANANLDPAGIYTNHDLQGSFGRLTGNACCLPSPRLGTRDMGKGPSSQLPPPARGKCFRTSLLIWVPECYSPGLWLMHILRLSLIEWQRTPSIRVSEEFLQSGEVAV